MKKDKPRILFAEDEVFIGLEMSMLLEESGFEVIGPLSSIADVMARLDDSAPDLALLDVNLNGTMITPVAEALRARSIPFALLTGYSAESFEEPVLRQSVLLRKPLDERAALEVLHGMAASRASEAGCDQ